MCLRARTQVELFDPSCRRRFTGLLTILAKLQLLRIDLDSHGSSSTILTMLPEGAHAQFLLHCFTRTHVHGRLQSCCAGIRDWGSACMHVST